MEEHLVRRWRIGLLSFLAVVLCGAVVAILLATRHDAATPAVRPTPTSSEPLIVRAQ